MALSKWNTVRLSEVVELRRGLSWSKQQERDAASDATVPVLRIGNVQERLTLDDLLHLDDVSAAERKARAVNVGWSLMVASNGNPARVGNCVYIDRAMALVFASFLVALGSSDSSALRAPYLYRLLRSEPIQRAVSKNVQGSTGLRNINLALLLKQKVTLPPTGEQDKIVGILDSIDTAIQRTRAVIEQARVVKQALLADLMTNGLPGRHKKFKTVQGLGRVPQGWQVTPLDNINRSDRPICYGILMPGSGHPSGVPVVKVKDIIDNRICTDDLLLTTPELDEQYRRSRLRGGELLVTIRGTTGRVAVIPDELEDANITQDTARVSPTSDVDTAFLFFALQSPDVQSQIRLHTIGQAVKGINIGEVRKLRIPLPDAGERSEIAKLLAAVDIRLEAEGRLLDQSMMSKKALSDALLTGRVRVVKEASK